jgi:predicted TIM-barrel fold metal-dependent hydrolase
MRGFRLLERTQASLSIFGPIRRHFALKRHRAWCMFESNFPVDKQSCGYTELWNAFKLATASLSPGERRDLFYRTACRAYRLPELSVLGDQLSTSP